jgi:hypothetical protein
MNDFEKRLRDFDIEARDAAIEGCHSHFILPTLLNAMPLQPPCAFADNIASLHSNAHVAVLIIR